MSPLAGCLVVAAVLLWPSRRVLGLTDDGTVAAPVSSVATGWALDPMQRWRVRRSAVDEERVAFLAMLESLQSALQAGLGPVQALAILRTRSVWLAQCMAELVDAGDLTGDPASGPWHRYAVQSGLSEARLFAGAWTISHRTGAPLADAVEVVARQARSERELSRRRRSAMAGPKATMTVLSALPLGGIGIGVATGVNPIEVVGASPVLQACVACGAALLVLGRWWSAQIMRAAERGD